MRPSHKTGFYGYVVLAAVWFVYFTNMGVFLYSIPAMNAKMIEVTGTLFSSTTIGLASGLCTVMQGLTGAVVGPYIAQKGCKPPLFIGTMALVGSGLAMGLLPPGPVCLCVVYGFGIGIGMGLAGIVTSQAVVNDWFDRKKTGAMAILLTGGAIGGFVGPLGARYFIVSGGWRWGWFYVSGVCFITLFVIWRYVIGKPAEIGQYQDGLPPAGTGLEKPAQSLTFQDVLYDRTVIFYIINYSTRTTLYSVVTGHVVLYLTGCQVGYEDAVFLISVLSITSLAGRLLCGILPETLIPAKTAIGVTNFMVGIGLVIIVLMPAVPAIYIGAAIFGIGLGYGHVASPVYLSRLYGNENFAVIVGGSAPATYLISALGPVCVGVSAAILHSYVVPFILAAALSIAGGVAGFAMKEGRFSPKEESCERCSDKRRP